MILGAEDEGQLELGVSSHALSLCSPVWKRMVQGPFSEAVQKRICLPSDNPDGVLIILAIAHMDWLRVPPRYDMDFDTLHAVAVVCHKYDMTAVVAPWIRDWMGSVRDIALTGEIHPDWLDIAWTFGDCETFKKVSFGLMMRGEVSANTLKYMHETVELQATPPGVVARPSHGFLQIVFVDLVNTKTVVLTRLVMLFKNSTSWMFCPRCLTTTIQVRS
ncbi:hypothetical protein BT63DRAFT_418678 [Microthyrium microscopicum]|uniref:BTB domain-containing protein n=1 Tax=Microthyrium microscopicum TaxID=703497 RepID=A0A6A6TY51_9PEZI|nr:hypothetical protein BT63DRAFT_418678 [Microthyrium microscopicum]